ncbi:MAG TPA: XRE family transcriptional regulator [Trebonia sp.]|nr:XRE family transcriptional regulator [Trebonia sp.]
MDDDGRAVDATLNTVIALRVKETRLRKGLPIRTVSDRTGISKGMLSKIENAQVSPSLGTLARLAEALEVPLTGLFRGFDEERDAVFVKAGQGAEIRRDGDSAGRHFQQLGAMRGQHRRMTPQLVTLTEPATEFPLYQHNGTEFLYMLAGIMSYGHGRAVYALEPGDALQFDAEASHGVVELTRLPVKFLSVTAVGSVHDPA